MERRRLQFSVRSLLMATSVVAVIASEAVAFPHWVAGLAGGLGTIAFAAFATIMVLHGEGFERTFAEGALFPLGWMLLSADFPRFNYYYGLQTGFLSHWTHLGLNGRYAIVFGWLFAIAMGMLCVLFRWLLENGQSRPRRSTEGTLDRRPDDD